MKRVLAIFGPTASGKSGLALALAKNINGVIISADSMQIYRDMNIGTAKPTSAEMQEVPHKMIDICSPSASFSVYDYKIKAEEEISNTLKDGQIPIVVGGTGLYFDALFFNNDFGEMEVNPDIRAKLNDRANAGKGRELLHELAEVDPEAAAPLHEKDIKRIIRGLEVYLSTGKTLSSFKAKSRIASSEFDFIKIFLNYKNRDTLYNRINQRVDIMLEQGLVEETIKLKKMGCFDTQTASQAIGYKELLPFLSGERSFDECVEILKQKSRNYAKRQLTWFRRYEDANVIWMDESEDPLADAQKIYANYLH